MADRSLTELIRIYFKAHETKNRSALESTLSDDFTSPVRTIITSIVPHICGVAGPTASTPGRSTYASFSIAATKPLSSTIWSRTTISQHRILHWKRRQDRNDRSIFRFENRQSRGHQVTPFLAVRAKVENHAVPAPLYGDIALEVDPEYAPWKRNQRHIVSKLSPHCPFFSYHDYRSLRSQRRYCSSLTFSIHSTAFPSRAS